MHKCNFDARSFRRWPVTANLKLVTLLHGGMGTELLDKEDCFTQLLTKNMSHSTIRGPLCGSGRGRPLSKHSLTLSVDVFSVFKHVHFVAWANDGFLPSWHCRPIFYSLQLCSPHEQSMPFRS